MTMNDDDTLWRAFKARTKPLRKKDALRRGVKIPIEPLPKKDGHSDGFDKACHRLNGGARCDRQDSIPAGNDDDGGGDDDTVTRTRRPAYRSPKSAPKVPAPKVPTHATLDSKSPTHMDLPHIALARGDLLCDDPNQPDRRTAQRLKRGKIAFQILDLHGFSRKDARQYLVEKIMTSTHPCLLVVTGKGIGNDGMARGILRRSLSQWVNEKDIRPLVLAFCRARPHHGGDGAFYLLLKKRHR